MSYELILPTDQRYFSQSSDAPYDRHIYELVFTNGQSEMYPSWETVHARWFQCPKQFLSHVNVVDIKNTKKGFK